jgi:hypothetical protein
VILSHARVTCCTSIHPEQLPVDTLILTRLEHLNRATMETPEDDFDDTPTNLAKPSNNATITIRVVKSFEYRVAKALVLHNMDLEHTTVGALKQRIRESTCDINMTQCECLQYCSVSHRRRG